MTTRVKGFVVTLAEDLREDDAEEIRRAIRLLRGVVSVDMAEADIHDTINRERIRDEFTAAIFAALAAQAQK